MERTITRLKKSILYKLKLKITKDSFIEAISFPKIFSPIRNQMHHFVKTNYDHLRNINLLKHSDGDSNSIDSIIGNDLYYSFLNGDLVKGQKDKPSL